MKIAYSPAADKVTLILYGNMCSLSATNPNETICTIIEKILNIFLKRVVPLFAIIPIKIWNNTSVEKEMKVEKKW